MSFWTDERVSRLEELWARGYSAGAVGELLGATRSAVAGKAWRLELPEREVIYTVRRKKRKAPRRPPQRTRPRLVKPPKLPRAPAHNGDFSWHLAKVASGVSARGADPPAPPEGLPSWRAFARRWASDPQFAAQVKAARLIAKSAGFTRRVSRAA